MFFLWFIQIHYTSYHIKGKTKLKKNYTDWLKQIQSICVTPTWRFQPFHETADFTDWLKHIYLVDYQIFF